MIDFIEMLQVCFLCACVGWTYVCRLTQAHQLLDFIPNYYRHLPKKTQTLLWCPYCISGWIAIGYVLVEAFFISNIVTYSIILTNLVLYPCVAMVLTGVILKQTELKDL